MKLIRKLFRKEPKVFYSCVIDDDPKFYWQGYIFVNSLVNLARVDGKRIFVHMTAKNAEFEEFLFQKNVNIKYIEPWGDRKYCNKLQQLETQELQQADYLFFCDADIAIVNDLSVLVEDSKNSILGKIVDFDNPDISTLEKIYDIFQLEHPKRNNDTLNGQETFEGNFNGGLYGMPSKYLEQFALQWKKYAQEMLNSDSIKELLAKKINHVDQISFSLALNKLKHPYKLLSWEFNCPTHIKDFDVLNQKLVGKDINVIHYHSNLSSVGLLNQVDNGLINKTINIINALLQNNFNNKLFWNYRYKTNPKLDSGVGSRGEIAEYKLRLLKLIGVDKSESVLDIGCGDLEIIKNLNIDKYTGVDISNEALKIAQKKYPQHKFVHAGKKEDVEYAETTLCLDVLIHQPSREEYINLINFAISKAASRLIISGYEINKDSSHMCFFYEDLRKSLESAKQFKYVFKVGEYRGLGLFVTDKGELSMQNTSNDINNKTLDMALEINSINSDLLLESVLVSRNTFGWFTKHYPRLYEYPWLLEKVGRNLSGLKIADFGAGVTPLPIQLAHRGAAVYTVDKHERIRTLENVKNANEWGFFDYSAVDKKIKSLNDSLTKDTFQNNFFDIWYSISVVEHMPAKIRRDIFKIMADTLKDKGKIYLTIDLVKDSEALWNMAEGKEVEDAKEHGTLDSFIVELEQLGFNINEKQIIRMPKDERVDIALISGILYKEKL